MNTRQATHSRQSNSCAVPCPKAEVWCGTAPSLRFWASSRVSLGFPATFVTGYPSGHTTGTIARRSWVWAPWARRNQMDGIEQFKANQKVAWANFAFLENLTGMAAPQL